MIVLNIGGYKDYVLQNKDAFTLCQILENAEVYETKYRGSGLPSTRHVYLEERELTMKAISDDVYRIAKLAGKPEDDTMRPNF